MNVDEFDAIGLLASRLGRGVAPPAGIGDDGAILRDEHAGSIVVVDTMVEGTHFRRHWSSFADVAFKLFNSNASDIFAMGGSPTCYFLAMTLPSAELSLLNELADGFAEAAAVLAPGIPLLGGDTTSGPQAVLTITMLGRAGSRVLARNGAYAGQHIWLDGPVGHAAAGLAALQQGDTAADPRLLTAHRRGWARRPQFADNLGGATAAVDISDGLGADLLRVATASSVAIELHTPLPGADVLRQCRIADQQALAMQLDGGDDYVRAVFSEQCPGPSFTAIGRTVAGGPTLTVITPDGNRRRWATSGYRHFS